MMAGEAREFDTRAILPSPAMEFERAAAPQPAPDPEHLREQVERLEAEVARLRARDELVGQTMVAATTFAMKVRAEARQEAELVLRKAQAEAAERVARVDRERSRAENELSRLRRVTDETRMGLASFLNSTLDQLRSRGEEAPRTTEALTGGHARSQGTIDDRVDPLLDNERPADEADTPTLR